MSYEVKDLIAGGAFALFAGLALVVLHWALTESSKD